MNTTNRIDALLTEWCDTDDCEKRDEIAGEIKKLAALAPPSGEGVVIATARTPDTARSSGPIFSEKDWAALRNLPDGTKLYTDPQSTPGDAAPPASHDEKALEVAQRIALMWGRDRSNFVAKIQVAVLEAMRFSATMQRVDGCHCATCTCNPGMTKAIRFDLSPSLKEGVVHDKLIELGWTPPASQERGDKAWTDEDMKKPMGAEIAFLRHLADDPALNVEQAATLRHCARMIERGVVAEEQANHLAEELGKLLNGPTFMGEPTLMAANQERGYGKCQKCGALTDPTWGHIGDCKSPSSAAEVSINSPEIDSKLIPDAAEQAKPAGDDAIREQYRDGTFTRYFGAHPSEQAQAGELPPLPQEVSEVFAADKDGYDYLTPGKCYYTADQMREYANACRLAGGVTVDDAMVETVGAALYIHWNDVNEQAKRAYRKKVRAAMVAALENGRG